MLIIVLRPEFQRFSSGSPQHPLLECDPSRRFLKSRVKPLHGVEFHRTIVSTTATATTTSRLRITQAAPRILRPRKHGHQRNEALFTYRPSELIRNRVGEKK